MLWTHGKVEVGTVAMALPLAWQIVNIAGWVALQVTDDLREHRRGAGGHDDHRPADRARPIAPDAPPLDVTRGEIAFEDVRFGYGRETGVHRRPDA